MKNSYRNLKLIIKFVNKLSSLCRFLELNDIIGIKIEIIREDKQFKNEIKRIYTRVNYALCFYDDRSNQGKCKYS